MVRKPIDTILLFAAERDIEINEVTVSPIVYKELVSEVIWESRIKLDNGNSELVYKGVLIRKKPCKGCCTHGD